VKTRPLPILAIRDGDVVLRGLATEGGLGRFPEAFEMFDVVNDPGEAVNLVTRRPDLFARLRGAMEALHRSVETDRQKTLRWVDNHRPGKARE
jgi:hypothetical protein